MVVLAPALGLIDLAYFSNSRVADHFQYLALPGVAALAAAVLRSKFSPAGWLVAWVLAGLLAGVTLRREAVLSDGKRLWEDNLAKNPNSWKVCMNLSIIRLEEGNTNEAIALKLRADELLRIQSGAAR